jgi:hypothetical protein
MFHSLHTAVRFVGIVVIAGLMVVSVAFYFSDEYDLLCDGLKGFERRRAGDAYHCYIGER